MSNPNFVIVPHIPHVYQFQTGKSAYRCEAFCLAALSAFAYPYRRQWEGLGSGPVTISDLNDLADRIYTHDVGPDTPQDTNGMTKGQAVAWFAANHIGMHDLQAIVDRCRASGNFDELRHEMSAMNRSGIPVLLGIDDESHLRTPDGKKLHSWNDQGLAHTIVRLGMDLDQPVTLILDPAAPCPPFPFPTPVAWNDIAQCRINTAIGVMPPGVVAPPTDFRFVLENGQEQKWPEPPAPPKPTIDVAHLLQSVTTVAATTQNALERNQDEGRLLEAQKAELGRLEEILKQVHPNLEM